MKNSQGDKVRIQQLETRVSELQYENSRVQSEYEKISNSVSWKITKPIRFVLDGVVYLYKGAGRVGKQVKRLAYLTKYTFKNYGLKVTVYKILHEGKNNLVQSQKEMQITRRAEAALEWEAFEKWLENTPHKFIDIFSVPMGWNTPLFQRFQHISLQVGKLGGISVYGAHPTVDQDVELYKFVSPTLCIVNLNDEEIKKKLFQILDTRDELKYVRIQSIDLATQLTEINDYLDRDYEVVYEYIDELTPQITGNIPEFVFKRHEALLRNENVIAVATSDKLYHQMKPYRNKNMAMINNGVDYEFWHIEKKEEQCPADIRKIVETGKIIVGYHGALAKWVDYDLLKRIAADGRFALLLIGHEHDECLKKSEILECENVYYIGARPYHELNQYSIFYDIGILPFLINDITLSVSPVKIFEYMAQGKPVVTYALPECQKYSSCLCAKDQDEFMKQLDKAVQLRKDETYLKQLDKDALDNTWLSITQKMLELVEAHHAAAQTDYDEEKEEKIILKDVVNYDVDGFYKDRYISQITHIPDAPNPKECVAISERSYEYQEGDPKIIAYYLTQFHPDPHNEEWWGRGTTEWDNVIRAVPQFEDHYQPRLPGELGCYDLRIKENMQRQIEIAKMYGIYGFSFYYYWFDGERLLEKPLEDFLANKDLEFPFSLCWANENWTRRFDGTNEAILMKQSSKLSSYKNVIEDIARFLDDERYIKVNGKKLLTVYRPSLMPDAQAVLAYWRDYCRSKGLGELYIIAVKENTVETDWLAKGFDAVSEFHPGTLYQNCKNITRDLQYIRRDFAGEVFSYEDIVKNKKYFRYNYAKLYRAIMPMWDNTARRNHKGMIFQGSTPKLYKKWLKDIIQEQKERDDLDDRLLFVNAWNEWGEGAYLEPDKKYGYAYLNATREAIEESRGRE